MVGMPQGLLLQEFGDHVWRAFGHICYHVGSSLVEKRGWRDVDVRLILPDDEYAALGLGHPDRQHHNKRWVSLVLCWSAFGKALTGLPIDFQIQQQTDANAKNPGRRSALFVVHNLEDRGMGFREHNIDIVGSGGRRDSLTDKIRGVVKIDVEDDATAEQIDGVYARADQDAYDLLEAAEARKKDATAGTGE